jgi:cytochrome oxidase Cu insertion factor (SCO1/SenC/PrrC family)
MRIYQVVLLAVTGIVIAAIAAFVLYGGGTGGKGVASIGGPFSLTDNKGQTKTDRDFRGRYMLIYFGYTYCPDVCPTALQSMTQAMDRLAPETQAKITPIFITIDPERDTAKQLDAYVENFHPRMVGLTGTPEQIAQTARLYRVYFGRAKDSGQESTEYLMDHSSIIFLMNPEGDYVTHFTHATTPEKMAERLATVVGR